MKRAVAITVGAAMCLLAQQTSRDPYRASYRVWRQAEPSLEQDAATGGASIAARTSHAAAEEAVYAPVRAEFLRALQTQHAQDLKWLETPIAQNWRSPSPASELQRITGSEGTAVAANISAFAGDNDRGIQQLQQALEKEQMALTSLDTAITDRLKAELKSVQANAVLESARMGAATQYRAAVNAFGTAAAGIDAENNSWATYYQKVADGARGGPTAPLLSAVLKAAAPDASAPADAPPPHVPTITPLPLARYTGAWTYNDVGGQFHGNKPEFVDLVVHAEGGKASGTLFARFKLAPGSKEDPLVRFDFSGDLQPTMTQTFKLLTSDNLSGTIDLIPGTAFNLLEVTFSTDLKPGKIHQGDLLLVKK